MRMAFWQHLTVLTALGLGASSFTPGAVAAQTAQFEQQEIDQSRFIVLAAPGGDIGYKLLILEQIKDSRPCWSETGSNPSTVDPLLLSFDFTGICNRIVDSNGFSVRTAGQDQALQYSLRLEPAGNDLVLIAASNTQRDVGVEIGRTNGLPAGFSRIVLNPGWRLTRRAFNGRAVGHIYLTYDQPMETVATIRRGSSRRPAPSLIPIAPPTSTSAPDREIDPMAPTIQDPGVIPVPALPPGSTTPVLPPINTPAPQTSSQTGSQTDSQTGAQASQSEARIPRTGTGSTPSGAPSLSSILPPPPPSDGSSASRPTPMTPAPRSDSSSSSTGSAIGGTSSAPHATGSTSGPEADSPSPTKDPAPSSSANRSTGRRTGSSANSSTTAAVQTETFQVVVVADSAELQDKVRAVAPSALLTTINGQVMMQVGIFRDRQEADRLQQRLSREGLSTAVIPVR
jgi:hypothetical protein